VALGINDFREVYRFVKAKQNKKYAPNKKSEEIRSIFKKNYLFNLLSAQYCVVSTAFRR
jgi:hypothetical protein